MTLVRRHGPIGIVVTKQKDTHIACYVPARARYSAQNCAAIAFLAGGATPCADHLELDRIELVVSQKEKDRSNVINYDVCHIMIHPHPLRLHAPKNTAG